MESLIEPNASVEHDRGIARTRRLRFLPAGPARHLRIGLLAMGVWSCGGGADVAQVELPRGADQVIQSLETQLSSQGRLALSIEGEDAYLYADSSVVWILGVQATAYGVSGETASTLSADSARLDREAQVLTLLGTVVVQSPLDGARLDTSELVYRSETHDFRSDSAVSLRRAGQVTEGSCFEGDATLATTRICP